MNFGLELVMELVEGGDVIELLVVFCRQMEYFFDSWKKFVIQKWMEYFYLNFYMVEQLVYLSIEFRKQFFSDVVLMMLFFIKSNCILMDVLRVFVGCESEVVRYCVRIVMEEFLLMFFLEFSLVDKLRVIMEQFMECFFVFLFDCFDLEIFGCCLVYLVGMGGFFMEWYFLRGL